MTKKPRFRLIKLLKILFFSLLVTCFLGGGWLIYTSVRDLPPINYSSLQPPVPTTIYDANDNMIAQLGSSKVIPVKLSQVPPVLKDAFLAAEDIRFYQNKGIDFRSIARAAWHDLTTLSLSQGASTITQQLAKNAFLTPDRTVKRKIQEVFMGFKLAHSFSKDEILSMYLNKIYMGDGAYGIGAAAKTYFNKDLSQLTLPEAALLAGLPQAPSAYSPIEHPDAAKERRDEILAKMLNYNLITQEQYVQAVGQDIQLNINLNSQQVTENKYPYYVDYVAGRLISRFGEEAVYKGGLKVYTNLDPKVQQAAQEAFSKHANFPASVRDTAGILQPEGAAVFLNPKDGAIVALVGGREHTGQRVLNRALQAYRQPGSTIKPFVAYGPAIEYAGMTPDSIVDDSPVSYGDYTPKNDNGSFRGPVTLRTALTLSINVVAVKLLNEVGIPQAMDFAKKVGLTSLDQQKEGLSMALGGLYKGVTPLEMAGAYGALANEGLYIKPNVLKQVVGQDGTILYQSGSDPHRAMETYTAAALTSMLERAVAQGTGVAARLPDRPAAGKTGTSEHGRDLWFCGFTPQLVGVVWIGYDQPKNTNQYGGTLPARIWHQVMTTALAEQPVIKFQDIYPDIYQKFGPAYIINTATPDNNSGTPDSGASSEASDSTNSTPNNADDVTAGNQTNDQTQTDNAQSGGITAGNANQLPDTVDQNSNQSEQGSDTPDSGTINGIPNNTNINSNQPN